MINMFITRVTRVLAFVSVCRCRLESINYVFKLLCVYVALDSFSSFPASTHLTKNQRHRLSLFINQLISIPTGYYADLSFA